MKDYVDLFAERGAAYHRAMQCWPNARRQEFQQVIDAADLMPGMIVADVPAGGGYLKGFAPLFCTVLTHEPCRSFNQHQASASASDLLPLPWGDKSIDVAISLAGVHHTENKRPFFREIRRVVRSGGRFVLSDVAGGSNIASFLDGFVGANNSTGHEGAFLGQSTLTELEDSGWRILSSDVVKFHWVFDRIGDIGNFCCDLFDIRKASPAEVEGVLFSELGLDNLIDGNFGMRWSLMTIVCE